MLSEYQIVFNYEKAIKQVAELQRIASSISSMKNTGLEECMGKIAKEWVGENGEAYLKKGRKLGTKIDKSVKNVHSTAETIETMAHNIYNAEMAALRAARRHRH